MRRSDDCRAAMALLYFLSLLGLLTFDLVSLRFARDLFW